MRNNSLLQIFYNESSELILEIEKDLVELEKSPYNYEIINNLFRAIHTIKGGSSFVSLSEISTFTHIVENVLERMRSKEIFASNELVSLLLNAVDILKIMIEASIEGRDLGVIAQIDELKQKLKSYCKITTYDEGRGKEKDTPKQTEGYSYYKISMKFNDNILETGTDPISFLADLEELGMIVDCATNIENVPLIDKIDIFKFYLSFDVVLYTNQPQNKVEDVFMFVIDDNEISINDVSREYEKRISMEDLANKQIGEILVEKGILEEADIVDAVGSQKKIGEILIDRKKIDKETFESILNQQTSARRLLKSSTIRINTEKLDNLINTAGEMVISVAKLRQLIKNDYTDNQDMDSTIKLLETICGGLQEQVMKARMFPIEDTFNKFQRLVRDLAASQNKKIKISMSGTETELDKNVIEKIEDPLKHLIRNSVDHGIEACDERLKMKKDEEGTIWLRAFQRGDNIFIEIQDDGRGIDRDKILEKALRLNVASDKKSYTDEEIYSFMFEPGFSTASQVTEISGRGVGLDVVKKNIDDLRGRVTVKSQIGKGATFQMRLPLTLAIIDGMNVRIGDDILTIPLMSVVSLIKPNDADVKEVVGEGEVMRVRNEFMPLVRLHDILGRKGAHKNYTEALAVVLESENSKFALLVDEVIGKQQTVIKSLGKKFNKVNCISGATILGNGQVSLILDTEGLRQLAFSKVNH